MTEDFDWFTKMVVRIAGDAFGEDVSPFVEVSHYFVDFIR